MADPAARIQICSRLLSWFEWIIASSPCANPPSIMTSPWMKTCRSIYASPSGTLATPRPTRDYTSTRLQYYWSAIGPEEGSGRAWKLDSQFCLLWYHRLCRAASLTFLWCLRSSAASTVAVCTAFPVRSLIGLLLKWVVVGSAEIVPILLSPLQEKITGFRKVPLK